MEKFGVSYQQIYSWVRKYNDKGAGGLIDKRGKRKPESEMTELERLRAENRMLEARNKRLETENAVLKKLEEIERRWR
jgi:transposase